MDFASHVLAAVVPNVFLLPLTVSMIHVHCWLTDTGATVAAAKLTSFCLLSYRFIIAEQTSQRSATEIEP